MNVGFVHNHHTHITIRQMLNSIIPGKLRRERSLQDAVLRKSRDFTMVPAAAMKAMEIGRSPACSVAEYSTAIESDVQLAAEILAMANCGAYSTGRAAASLRAAVMRLGMRKCQNLILSSCSAALMRQLPCHESEWRERLWKHSFATALICRHLNERMSLGFQGEEFTAGLMHDLGRSLLAASAPDEFSRIDALDFMEDAETPVKEHALVKTSHCEIGALFGKQSGLPAPLIAVIRHHHDPQSSGSYKNLVALVAVADHFANHFISRTGEPYDASANPYIDCSLGNSERTTEVLAEIAQAMTPEEVNSACPSMA